jgi:hypothetical protein
MGDQIETFVMISKYWLTIHSPHHRSQKEMRQRTVLFHVLTLGKCLCVAGLCFW